MKYWNQGEDRSTIDLASPDIRGRPTGDDGGDDVDVDDDYDGDYGDNDEHDDGDHDDISDKR